MRVLLDATVLELPVTGIARATMGLYAACTNLNPLIQVTAVHRRPLTCCLPFPARSVQLASWLPGTPWRKVALPLMASFTHPAVIHFPWNNGVVRSFLDTAIVLTLHDVIPLALPSLHFRTSNEEENYRKKIQQNLDRTDLVVTDSECSKKDILANFHLHREPVVIYNANLLLNNGTIEPIASEYFLYSGGYDRRKGLDILVKVYRQLYADQQIRIPLVLIGKPEYFSVQFKRDVLAGLEEGSIIEKGYVNDNQMISLLKGAKALIYPSFYEGFGYPPLEAMTQGCPVITTNISSLPEICGEAAIYVKPNDLESLANAIIEISQNETLRLNLQHQGIKQAKKFSWQRSSQKYITAIENLLREKLKTT